jgi:hypothetical protein
MLYYLFHHLNHRALTHLTDIEFKLKIFDKNLLTKDKTNERVEKAI